MKDKFFSVIIFLNVILLSTIIVYHAEHYNGYQVIVAYNYPTVNNASRKEGMEVLTEEELNEPIDNADHEPMTVSFPLELNHATLEELKLIPKIGETTGQRIVQYRDYIGGYSEVSQLMEIKGIGKQSYEEISKYLYLEGDA